MSPLKKFARYAHRYLGWLSFIVVAILCGTGALLVIQPEIERVVEPERSRLPGGAKEPLSLDEFVASFEKAESASFEKPTEVAAVRLSVPKRADKPWYALVSAKDADSSWIYMAYVDPSTARGVAYGPSRTLGFFKTVRRLHTSLCVRGRIGRLITGWATFIFLFVLLTGLIRWLPARLKNGKAWKSRLVPTVTKGYFRAIYDLHNVLGFWSALVLLILAFTGCWISFSWFRDACDRATGYEPGTWSAEEFRAVPGEETASLQEIFNRQIAQTGRGDYEFFLPSKGSETPLVIRRSDGFCRPDEWSWDQYSGELLGVSKFGDQPVGLRFRSLMTPVHKGVLWGNVTRWIALTAALVGVILCITGILLTFRRWDSEEKRNALKDGVKTDDINGDSK